MLATHQPIPKIVNIKQQNIKQQNLAARTSPIRASKKQQNSRSPEGNPEKSLWSFFCIFVRTYAITLS
jgi:hypothetical protein